MKVNIYIYISIYKLPFTEHSFSGSTYTPPFLEITAHIFQEGISTNSHYVMASHHRYSRSNTFSGFLFSLTVVLKALHFRDCLALTLCFFLKSSFTHSPTYGPFESMHRIISLPFCQAISLSASNLLKTFVSLSCTSLFSSSVMQKIHLFMIL